MNRPPLTIARRGCPAALLLPILFAGCAGLPDLHEAGTDVALGVDVLGKYVWRGIVVADVTVAQPSLDITNGGFNANVWTSMDLEEQDGTDNERQFNEIDLTLCYSHDVGPVALTGGVVHYIFPNAGLPAPGSTLKDGDTTELIVGAGLADVPLAPTLTGYFDVDEAHGGAYLALGASHSFALELAELPSFSTIDLSASLGWGTSDHNDFYFGGPVGDGLVDFKASIGVPIDLGEKGDGGWVLTPSLTYTGLIDSALRDAHGDDDSNLIWGLSFAVAF
jgi:hypothetical protein